MDVSSQATRWSGRAPASKTLPVRPPGSTRLGSARLGSTRPSPARPGLSLPTRPGPARLALARCSWAQRPVLVLVPVPALPFTGGDLGGVGVIVWGRLSGDVAEATRYTVTGTGRIRLAVWWTGSRWGRIGSYFSGMRVNLVNATFVRIQYSGSGAEKIKMASHGFVLLLMHEFITPNQDCARLMSRESNLTRL